VVFYRWEGVLDSLMRQLRQDLFDGYDVAFVAAEVYKALHAMHDLASSTTFETRLPPAEYRPCSKSASRRSVPPSRIPMSLLSKTPLATTRSSPPVRYPSPQSPRRPPPDPLLPTRTVALPRATPRHRAITSTPDRGCL
jgi:hypothetical protein